MGSATTQQQWRQVLSLVSEQVTHEQFSTWFNNVELLKLDSGSVEIGVANRFIKEWLLGHYREIITAAIGRVTGSQPELLVTISSSMFRKMREIQDRDLDVPPRRTFPASEMRGEGVPLNPEFVLESFIVGPTNRLAYAAATAVVERPAQVYNPFFLFGSAGLGWGGLSGAGAAPAPERVAPKQGRSRAPAVRGLARRQPSAGLCVPRPL